MEDFTRRAAHKSRLLGSEIGRHRLASLAIGVLLAGGLIRQDVAAAAPAAVGAQARVALVPGGCPRSEQSGPVELPPELSDPSGSLNVSFSFQQDVDAQNRALYCFVTPEGLQNPTLYVSPGGTLTVTLTNNTAAGQVMPPLLVSPCFDAQMTTASVNIHYHGTNTPPVCGGDEVIKTSIMPNETIVYTIAFPMDEPPGLYWYHPHLHGISDPYVIGGATGALVVNGIESLQPAVAGLPQQMIVVRDQAALAGPNEGPGNCGNGVPFRDVTVNSVPVNSFQVSQKLVYFLAGSLSVEPNEPQFWRVANTAADTILDLQIIYDGVPQTFAVVAIDGVPVNSQDGITPGNPIPATHFRLPPASRVEFIVTTPSDNVKSAQLVTSNINTGAAGDCDPLRPLLQIVPADEARAKPMRAALPLPAGAGRRFARLGDQPINAYRTVFFDENTDLVPNQFYMSVVGGPQKQVFDPNMQPGVVTQQGWVEQWTVQNRTLENHEFHIHQIHFMVQSQDNFRSHPTAPGIKGQYLDTIEVPAWDGLTLPYPSVTLLMDFTGNIAGSFVFHCHILGHEDLGMMNIVQVVGPNAKPSPAAARRPVPDPAKTPAHRH